MQSTVAMYPAWHWRRRETLLFFSLLQTGAQASLLPLKHHRRTVEQGEERAPVLWVIESPGDFLKMDRFPVYDAISLRLVLPAAKLQPNQDDKIRTPITEL